MICDIGTTLADQIPSGTSFKKDNFNQVSLFHYYYYQTPRLVNHAVFRRITSELRNTWPKNKHLWPLLFIFWPSVHNHFPVRLFPTILCEAFYCFKAAVGNCCSKFRLTLIMPECMLHSPCQLFPKKDLLTPAVQNNVWQGEKGEERKKREEE